MNDGKVSDLTAKVYAVRVIRRASELHRTKRTLFERTHAWCGIIVTVPAAEGLKGRCRLELAGINVHERSRTHADTDPPLVLA